MGYDHRATVAKYNKLLRFYIYVFHFFIIQLYFSKLLIHQYELSNFLINRNIVE